MICTLFDVGNISNGPSDGDDLSISSNCLTVCVYPTELIVSINQSERRLIGLASVDTTFDKAFDLTTILWMIAFDCFLLS